MAKSVSTGARKAARKAASQGVEKKAGAGAVVLDSIGSRGPVVFGLVDRGKGTEQTTVPVKGSNKNFKQNVKKAESRAQSFIDGGSL